jgi:hypothetical protein
MYDTQHQLIRLLISHLSAFLDDNRVLGFVFVADLQVTDCFDDFQRGFVCYFAEDDPSTV